MRVKPMPFNADMVQALLEGRKTVTRRVVKEPYYIDDADACIGSGLAMHRGINATHEMPYPDRPYQPGDILYVQETFFKYKKKYYYKADGAYIDLNHAIGGKEFFKWHPSIHMPKEAARIFLQVTDVRVERLQDITSEGIYAEGTSGGFGATRGAFAMLWDGTIKPADIQLYGWMANPWVWVIEFERISKEGRIIMTDEEKAEYSEEIK